MTGKAFCWHQALWWHFFSLLKMQHKAWSTVFRICIYFSRLRFDNNKIAFIVRMKIKFESFTTTSSVTKVAVTIAALSGAIAPWPYRNKYQKCGGFGCGTIGWYYRDQRFSSPAPPPQRRTKFSIGIIVRNFNLVLARRFFFWQIQLFFTAQFEDFFCFLSILIRDKKKCFCNGIWRRFNLENKNLNGQENLRIEYRTMKFSKYGNFGENPKIRKPFVRFLGFVNFRVF